MHMPPQFRNDEPWKGFLMEADFPPSIADASSLAGKRILITGAGGYIGAALSRAVAMLGPRQLLLMDNSEHGLYTLGQLFQSSALSLQHFMTVGDVCDRNLLQQMFEAHQPQVVFHAAALKHVQLMETNPIAAAQTNILGTQAVVEAAASGGAEQLVLISTDKAVDPISIMGATKRLAELIVLGGQPACSMKVLRLCNVLGSSGSVAPLFVQQVLEERPVTVTHREATRYFISAAETVLFLFASAAPSVMPGLFIPRVGPPYNIQDLALFLINHASNVLHRAPILHTDLRVGDKLHEQLISPRELLIDTDPSEMLHRVETPLLAKSVLEAGLQQIRQAVEHRDLPQLLRVVQQLVPEYAANESLGHMAPSMRQP